MKNRILVFEDKHNQWRWHLLASNGKKICTSGEAFYSKRNALRAAHSFGKRLKETIYHIGIQENGLSKQ